MYSQLTVIPFDAFGGTVALPTVDVAHVGMVVALAGCREQRKGVGEGVGKNVLDPLTSGSPDTLCHDR